MFPGQSLLSISNGSGTTAITYCDDIKFEIVTEEFELSEFTHARMLSAPENDGTEPTTVRLLFNKPAQIVSTGSVTTTGRPLGPDLSNLDQIFKKFSIRRITVTGSETNNSDMANLYAWSILHRTLLDRFSAHQKFVGANISYSQLLTLQAETFSYLTNTGYILTTESLGTVTNVLIRSLNVGVAYSVNTPQGLLVLNDYTLVADVISIVPLSSL